MRKRERGREVPIVLEDKGRLSLHNARGDCAADTERYELACVPAHPNIVLSKSIVYREQEVHMKERRPALAIIACDEKR